MKEKKELTKEASPSVSNINNSTINKVSDEDEKDLLSKISDTAKIIEDDLPEVPLGTAIEDEMENIEQDAGELVDKDIQPEKPEAPYGYKADGTPRKTRPGSGRGNRTKAEKSSTYQELKNEQPDIIGSAVNGMIIPLIAKRAHKTIDDCQLSAAQLKEIKQFQPPMDFARPSWPMYTLALVSHAVGNFMTASKDKDWLELQEKIKSEVKTQVDSTMAFNSRRTPPETKSPVNDR